MQQKVEYLRNLEERKEEVIRLIEEQGKLTEELRNSIIEAKTSAGEDAMEERIP